jgi:hypothetical protein
VPIFNALNNGPVKIDCARPIPPGDLDKFLRTLSVHVDQIDALSRLKALESVIAQFLKSGGQDTTPVYAAIVAAEHQNLDEFDRLRSEVRVKAKMAMVAGHPAEPSGVESAPTGADDASSGKKGISKRLKVPLLTAMMRSMKDRGHHWPGGSEITKRFESVFGIRPSKGTISNITNAIGNEDLKEWQDDKSISPKYYEEIHATTESQPLSEDEFQDVAGSMLSNLVGSDLKEAQGWLDQLTPDERRLLCR